MHTGTIVEDCSNGSMADLPKSLSMVKTVTDNPVEGFDTDDFTCANFKILYLFSKFQLGLSHHGVATMQCRR